MAGSMQEPDDDPVTAEYDVWLSPRSDEEFLLLQFPNRENTQIPQIQHGEVKIKPKTGFVELDIPLRSDVYYNIERATKWGTAMGQAQERGNTTFGMAGGMQTKFAGASLRSQQSMSGQLVNERGTQIHNLPSENNDALERQTLGGQITRPGAGKPTYMLGKFNDDKLELSPLVGTVQMRHQFHYLDAERFIDRENARRQAVADMTRSAEARPVQAQRHRREYEDPSREVLEKAYEEPWVMLDKETKTSSSHPMRSSSLSKARNSTRHSGASQTSPDRSVLTSTLTSEAYLDSMSAPRSQTDV